jgi:putative transposase
VGFRSLRVNYHFVWCPKYRHAILEPIENSLEASFRDVCDEYGYEILSLHISPDHVHLFLSAHPKHAPSEIARTVKSITAREMGSVAIRNEAVKSSSDSCSASTASAAIAVVLS